MPLRSRLLRIGRAAGARSESGGIRFVALALASLSLALSLVSVIAATAVEDARAQRIAAGGFVRADDATPSDSTLLVRTAIDHLRGGRQYAVVYITPLGDDAPVPPGLDEIPAPGTAVMSPELASEGRSEAIDERYGEVAATIDISGLADPTELLVYVRPHQDVEMSEESTVTAVAAFDDIGPEIAGLNVHWVLDSQDFETRTVALLALVLGVVPSVVLAFVASRVASHSRDRRDALITVLGGRMRDRLWVAAGEAWVPVLVGALGAAAVIAWFSSADRRLPLVDYVVQASDLDGLWWFFVMAIGIACGLVLASAVVLSAVNTFRRGNRPRKSQGSRVIKIRAVTCVLFVGVAAFGPYLFSDRSPAFLLTGYVGLTGIVLTMPGAIAVFVGRLGRVVARSGRRPALLTAGRRMSHRPGSIARQVFGICACILFLLFSLTQRGNFSSEAVAADAYLDEHGYSLMTVNPRGKVTTDDVTEFRSALPDEIRIVAYTHTRETVGEEPGGSVVHMIGTCDELEPMSLPCPTDGATESVDPAETASEVRAWLGQRSQGTSMAVTVDAGSPVAAIDDGSISLLAYDANGNDIAAGVVNVAGKVFPRGVSTNVPGGSWLVGAIPSQEQSDWVTLIGGGGLAILVLATGFGLASEFLRFGRSIAPLSVLSGNTRVYWRSSAAMSLLPLILAVGGGFSIGWLAVRPMINTGTNLITPTLIISCCASALAAGMIMWSWSAMAAVRSAGRWKPGRGDD